MENIIKWLLNNINSKEIVKLLEKNISWIIEDENEKIVTITINKKYVMNDLLKSDNLDLIKSWVHKTFWEDYSINLKLKWNSTHDREMLISHNIHY